VWYIGGDQAHHSLFWIYDPIPTVFYLFPTIIYSKGVCSTIFCYSCMDMVNSIFIHRYFVTHLEICCNKFDLIRFMIQYCHSVSIVIIDILKTYFLLDNLIYFLLLNRIQSYFLLYIILFYARLHFLNLMDRLYLSTKDIFSILFLFHSPNIEACTTNSKYDRTL